MRGYDLVNEVLMEWENIVIEWQRVRLGKK